MAAVTEANPTHVRLSNKSFDNGAAAVVAEYLSQLTELQVADISDIIAGRPEDEALRTMSIISNSLQKFPLVELNVSDNAMGAKGIEACRGVLLNEHLQRLYVCNDGLSAEACRLLADILLTGSSSVPKLTVLHCYNNMAGDGGAVAFGDIVTACPTIENFRFSATRSTKTGCMSIATVRPSYCSLMIALLLLLLPGGGGAAAVTLHTCNSQRLYVPQLTSDASAGARGAGQSAPTRSHGQQLLRRNRRAFD